MNRITKFFKKINQQFFCAVGMVLGVRHTLAYKTGTNILMELSF